MNRILREVISDFEKHLNKYCREQGIRLMSTINRVRSIFYSLYRTGSDIERELKNEEDN